MTEQNKIVVICPVWLRPRVLEQFLENHYNLVPRPTVILAGSPHDDCMFIASRYDNVIYTQGENLPVSKKFNDACSLVKDLPMLGLDNGEATHFILTGSDDFMSQKTWEYYLAFNGDHLGLRDLFFYDSITKKCFHFMGYTGRREGTPIGACHMISADVMEKLNYRPYVDEERFPREQSVWKKVCDLGVQTKLVTMAETGGIVADVKSEVGIMAFTPVANKNGVYPDCKFVDSKVIEESDIWQYIKAI
jgi:hypothetical protein